MSECHNIMVHHVQETMSRCFAHARCTMASVYMHRNMLVVHSCTGAPASVLASLLSLLAKLGAGEAGGVGEAGGEVAGVAAGEAAAIASADAVATFAADGNRALLAVPKSLKV